MEEIELTVNYIDDLLEELEQHLEQPTEIILLGGAVLAIKDIRDMTYDIDVFNWNKDDKARILKAAKEVSLTKLNPHWINYDVETLSIRFSLMNRTLYKKIGNLSIYTVDTVDLLTLKIFSYANRGSNKDLEDVSSLIYLNEDITKELIKTRMKVICPTFLDYDLIDDSFNTAPYFLPENIKKLDLI